MQAGNFAHDLANSIPNESRLNQVEDLPVSKFLNEVVEERSLLEHLLEDT